MARGNRSGRPRDSRAASRWRWTLALLLIGGCSVDPAGIGRPTIVPMVTGEGGSGAGGGGGVAGVAGGGGVTARGERRVAAWVSPAPLPGRPVKPARRPAPAETRGRGAARSQWGRRRRCRWIGRSRWRRGGRTRRRRRGGRRRRRRDRRGWCGWHRRGRSRWRRRGSGRTGVRRPRRRGRSGRGGGGGRGGAGGSGPSCDPCPACMRCVNGACSAEPTSLWKVRCIRAAIAQTKPGGDPWDLGTGNPRHRIRSARSGSAIPRRRRRRSSTTPSRPPGTSRSPPAAGSRPACCRRSRAHGRFASPTTTRPARTRSAPSARRSTRRRFRPDWRPSRRGAARRSRSASNACHSKGVLTALLLPLFVRWPARRGPGVEDVAGRGRIRGVRRGGEGRR